MMVAPPPQRDSTASLKQRRNAGTPSISSVGATFPSTGAHHDGLPTYVSLSPLAAPHQQPVAGTGKHLGQAKYVRRKLWVRQEKWRTFLVVYRRRRILHRR